MYQDRALTCRDCTEEFIFSAGEQTFYATKGLTNDPQRCPTCRAAAKRARSTDGPREFHAAICGACGGQAVVPFAPRNDRPVYCSSCFDKVAGRYHHDRGTCHRVTASSKEPAVGVIIIREMVGTSPRSWSDAARQAVATASRTVRNIQTVEVVKSTAVVRDGEIVEYRVEVKIGFEYED